MVTDLADLRKQPLKLSVGKAEKQLDLCPGNLKSLRNWLAPLPLEVGMKVGLELGDITESGEFVRFPPALQSAEGLEVYSQNRGTPSTVQGSGVHLLNLEVSKLLPSLSTPNVYS